MKILYIGNGESSFVKHEVEILRKFYDVQFYPTGSERAAFQFALKLIPKVKNNEIIYCNFASLWSAIAILEARLLRKKSLVTVGGYDAAHCPQFNYGVFTNPRKKYTALFCYRYSNRILVTAHHLKNDILSHCKLNHRKILYSPRGHDEEFWKPSGKKTRVIITVASVKNISRAKIKGLDMFVKVAKKLPEEKFVIIGPYGKAKDYITSIMPANVELIGKKNAQELLYIYQHAKIYCQFSYREGMPNSLCEAMLCECIPVVTEIPGNREAVGETGYYCDYNDVNMAVKIIKQALVLNIRPVSAIRKRIIQYFSDEQKLFKVIDAINEVL
jgi:glycosyltransferase involved in cell wall biosynthesis